MNSGSLALNLEAQGGALTAERVETKYLVPRERLPGLLQRVSSRPWGGENAPPGGAQYMVTSLYFDTPSRAYFLAARQHASKNLKLRLREYSEVQAPSSELVTEPPVLPPPEPWVWLELKQREGSTTSKRRIRIPRANAASLFVRSRAGQALSQEQEQREVEALLLHLKDADEPLEPSALVRYRRQSFQADEGQLRVTIDLGVAYYRVQTSSMDLTEPLARSAVGAAVGGEPHAVVEIKRLGSLPSWLEQTLFEIGAPAISFSKFVAASEALRGAR